MEASLKAANEVYAETSARNADFKKIYDSLLPFRSDQFLCGRSPSTTWTPS